MFPQKNEHPETFYLADMVARQKRAVVGAAEGDLALKMHEFRKIFEKQSKSLRKLGMSTDLNSFPVLKIEYGVVCNKPGYSFRFSYVNSL